MQRKIELEKDKYQALSDEYENLRKAVCDKTIVGQINEIKATNKQILSILQEDVNATKSSS